MINKDHAAIQSDILNAYYANNATKLHRVVDRILSKFGGLSYKDTDDFYSLANEVFADVMERYDYEQSFDGFLYSCLSNKIMSEITKRNREKRKADRLSVSLNATNDNGEEYSLLDCVASDFDTFEEAMKVHAGVDAGSGYVHTITGTSANVHDITETSKLIREDDEVVYGDSGYLGAAKRPEIQEDKHLSQVEFRINVRPKSIKAADDYKGINWDKQIENRKSSTRSQVEHPFLIVKKQFGYCKVAYRGIAKNMNRFHILFASANLVMCARAGRTKDFCSAMG